MTRATLIAAITAYLEDAYTGPVAIHPQVSTETLAPPYMIIEVEDGEELYPGQVEIWSLPLKIGVAHDADATTAAAAEQQAAAIFALLEDPAPLFASSSATIVWSALERQSISARVEETRWFHIASYTAIVAPPAG